MIDLKKIVSSVVIKNSRYLKVVEILLPILILIFYGSFLAHKVSLLTADLGRHIKNGEMIFETLKVLDTNLYSYSYPEFGTINHHWATGLIFYLLWIVGGISLVQIFYIVLSLSVAGILYILVRKKIGIGLGSLCVLLAIFLFSNRTEIRPEVFTYLFIAVFLYALYLFRDKFEIAYFQGKSLELKYYKILFLLPILEIAWVNFHIYHILGPIIIGTFLVESLIRRRESSVTILSILILTIFSELISPFGIYGLLEVLAIKGQFGYSVSEMQSVKYLFEVTGGYFQPTIFFTILIITGLSFLIPIVLKKWKEIDLTLVIFFIGFSYTPWIALRNISVFGIFACIITAYNLNFLYEKCSMYSKNIIDWCALTIVALLVVFTFSTDLMRNFSYWNVRGIGLEQDDSMAANFIKNENISGPIFNDYDIGGYLIYHLYPERKVFVDNRPEAYPKNYFYSIYIPMQVYDSVWQFELSKYKFNSIIFSSRDRTIWAKNFIKKRLNDSSWATVYFDEQVIIFLRRNEQNMVIINRYESEMKLKLKLSNFESGLL